MRVLVLELPTASHLVLNWRDGQGGMLGMGVLPFLAAALPALGLALVCKTLLILLLFRDFSCLDAAWAFSFTINVAGWGGARGGLFSCEH